MGKSYELFLHYKQGDDFGQILRENQSDVPKALRAWAARFKENVAICERLAKAFEGQKLVVEADTHHISFDPTDGSARKCLEAMAVEKLIHVYEFEEDEDEDESGAEEDKTGG